MMTNNVCDESNLRDSASGKVVGAREREGEITERNGVNLEASFLAGIFRTSSDLSSAPGALPTLHSGIKEKRCATFIFSLFYVVTAPCAAGPALLLPFFFCFRRFTDSIYLSASSSAEKEVGSGGPFGGHRRKATS